MGSKGSLKRSGFTPMRFAEVKTYSSSISRFLAASSFQSTFSLSIAKQFACVQHSCVSTKSSGNASRSTIFHSASTELNCTEAPAVLMDCNHASSWKRHGKLWNARLSLTQNHENCTKLQSSYSAFNLPGLSRLQEPIS